VREKDIKRRIENVKEKIERNRKKEEEEKRRKHFF